MGITEDLQQEIGQTESRQISSGSQDYTEKKKILDKIRQKLAKDPRNVSLLNQVGRAAEAAGDNERARWAYKRAIRLEPGYEQSYRNLGLLYRKEGREGQAAELLGKYMQWAGEDAELIAVQDASNVTVAVPDTEPSATMDETPIYARLNQVWEEMELTPAEAMMLLEPEESNGLQMMQVTLLDLVARGVLEADERNRIGRGEAYNRTDLAPHEALFAKYFSRISDYVDINKLARAALAETDDDGTAYRAAYVRESLLQKGYLEWETKRIAGLLPVQQAVPSKKGAQARNRLQRLLKEADRQLARSLANNPEQANAYVERGGPALLLLDAYPENRFKRWHDMLTRIGFGPAIKQIRSNARKSDLGAIVDDFLKTLLGS